MLVKLYKVHGGDRKSMVVKMAGVAKGAKFSAQLVVFTVQNTWPGNSWLWHYSLRVI